MNRYIFLSLIVLSGFLTGVIVYDQLNRGEEYCNNIEREVVENQSFESSVACYTPRDFDVRRNEDLVNRTDLDCICRIIDDNGVRLTTVSTSR